jgi:hypothetical protein
MELQRRALAGASAGAAATQQKGLVAPVAARRAGRKVRAHSSPFDGPTGRARRRSRADAIGRARGPRVSAWRGRIAGRPVRPPPQKKLNCVCVREVALAAHPSLVLLTRPLSIAPSPSIGPLQVAAAAAGPSKGAAGARARAADAAASRSVASSTTPLVSSPSSSWALAAPELDEARAPDAAAPARQGPVVADLEEMLKERDACGVSSSSPADLLSCFPPLSSSPLLSPPQHTHT